MRVLVLESSPDTGRKTAHLLQQAGHEVTGLAHDPESAMAALEHKPECVLADLSLVSANHGEVLKVLARGGCGPSCVLILPKASERLLEVARKLGVRGHVVRPFSAADLQEALAGRGSPAKPTRQTRPHEFGADSAAKESAPPKPQKDEQPEVSSEEHATACRYFALGFEALRKRKFDTAIKDFALAVKHQVVFPEAYKGLSEAFRGKGEQKKATHFLDVAAQNYVLSGKDAEAEELFHERRKADAATPNPYAVVAESYGSTGDDAEALVHWEKAVALTPKEMAPRRKLAKACHQAGRKEEAVEALMPLLSHGDPDPAASDLFREITGVGWGEQPEGGEETPAEEEKPSYTEKRRSPRVPLVDCFVRTSRKEEPLPVVDISRTGVGFKVLDHGDAFKPGAALHFDLLALEKVKVKKLHARVAHVTDGVCGCRFVDLSDKQKKLINKVMINESPPGEFVIDSNVNFDIEMW